MSKLSTLLKLEEEYAKKLEDVRREIEEARLEEEAEGSSVPRGEAEAEAEAENPTNQVGNDEKAKEEAAGESQAKTEEDWEGDVEGKLKSWKDAGNAAFQKGDYDTASENYSIAIKVLKKLGKDEDKQYCTIYANRSAAHLATKKWVKASWDAQCAVRCDPEFWKAHWRHGVSLMAMAPRIERSQNAVDAFERCLPLAPEAKRAEVEEALSRARIRLQEGKDRTPMPPQCQQS